MHPSQHFLANLALVLGVAAATTILFQRLRQPVVLGYLLAGMIIGPHVPVPLVADPEVIHTLSELGVILLMFSLGLEFSVRTLFRVAPTAGLIAVIQCSLMLWLGYLAGQWLGWTPLESVYAGAIIAISSTTIIVKAFAEQGVRGRLAELVFGVLVVEDLIAILLLTVLTAVAAGTALTPAGLALTVGRLGAFLGVLLVGGLLVVPRLVRAVVALGRPETTVVASTGLCFGVALLTGRFGYEMALGAFLAGALVAESGVERQVARLVEPVRDVFAAVFFVAVGLRIDPVLAATHWPAVLLFTVLVVGGKVAGVALGGFLAGQGVRTSVQAGMSLAQIGEFSFIIAGVGLATRAAGELLYTVAVAVSGLTTLLTPWLIRSSEPVARLVDRHLPRAVQTFVALYGTWFEQLRAGPGAGTAWARARRPFRVLLVDAALLAALVILASTALETLADLLVARVGLAHAAARAVVVIVAAALSVPLCFGLVRSARVLGRGLGALALPAAERGVDLAAAPRRALTVVVEIIAVLLVGVPLLALTQPFLPSPFGLVVLAAAVVALGIAFWRSARNLQGHVDAVGELLLEALGRQMRREQPDALERVQELVPALGPLTTVDLAAGCAAVGRTLADLDVHGRTDATILAIQRGTDGLVAPTGRERLAVGDVLVLAGSATAQAAAAHLLRRGTHASDDEAALP
jgi:monovalent cation:H+ antiporter-2, CPA2 family